MLSRLCSLLLALGLLLSATLHAQEPDWQPLFDGATLDGWTSLGGTAPYEVVDGVIVGTARPDTPNTFLTTDATYGDFILEYEVWVDDRLNSGVQIRSQSLPDYRNGRVHGYQVELDPSPRAYTGGIYDEARRGWIYPLARNPKGQPAFQHGVWNRVHVEAVGPELFVWVNDQMTARLVDDMTAEGFIGLQVHSINDPALAGAQVMWRNLRIHTGTPAELAPHRWRPDPDVPEVSFLVNRLTPHEERQGWRLLWDGATADGWRGARLDDFPATGWGMDGGILTVEASGGGESEGGGDIVTRDVFSSFELELDFMITEGANSGIKYFVDTDLNKGPGSSIGLEYQILDDERHPDAAQGVGGNRTLGSLYDLIPATNVSVPSRGKPFNGIGQWNRARLVVRGNQIEHWLNNILILRYERGTQMYRALVEKSKYDVWPNFGEAPAGHILLQDHGDEVSFRSIKIREF
ncbi:MAG: DUF1080 domain-containing protein [Bacteroidota bacterium]